MELYFPNENAIVTYCMTEDNFNANLTKRVLVNPVIDDSVHSVTITSITVINNHTDGVILKTLGFVLADGEPAYMPVN